MTRTHLFGYFMIRLGRFSFLLRAHLANQKVFVIHNRESLAIPIGPHPYRYDFNHCSSDISLRVHLVASFPVPKLDSQNSKADTMCSTHDKSHRFHF